MADVLTATDNNENSNKVSPTPVFSMLRGMACALCKIRHVPEIVYFDILQIRSSPPSTRTPGYALLYGFCDCSARGFSIVRNVPPYNAEEIS